MRVGFMGNPVLYPLFNYTKSSDVVLVQLDPIERPGPPNAGFGHDLRFNKLTAHRKAAIEVSPLGCSHS
jgi:NTE family protein